MKWYWRSVGFITGTMYLTGLEIIFMEDEQLIAALTWLATKLGIL